MKSRSILPRDHQQRLRRHIEATGGPLAFAERHGINPRTAQRIFTGKAACPRAVLEAVIAGETGA